MLERLTDLIIPVENGAPGALAAGAPAWIDMISSENDRLKSIYAERVRLDGCGDEGARRRRLRSARRRRSRPRCSI